ncbi:outer membrane lipoprotein carrier protein LolA [Halomonas sp. ML-15]|uniref:LolA family protein n=1 Tax=Halomonas sp. ML-15 TaxID=2773305 RepID=UPI001747A997|nr:outer membrane lipoprotein carrier protein LolA [Halomonas sp. ML-15]MBD3895733.1 outer membrane lipoprotein carrier protein LolA [Halomonas sp. ML-15]
MLLASSFPVRPLLVVMASTGVLCASAQALEREELQRQLAAPAQLQGNFEQRHWLEDQQSRLHSDGHFLYQRERLLVWRFSSPREATLAFPKRLPGPRDEIEEVGLPDRELLDELLPGRAEFGRHLVDLLGGNWGALEEDYAIALSGEADEWQARFSPRSPALETDLGELLLSGDDSGWQHLEIQDANGDELQISFSSISPMVDESLSGFLGQWLEVEAAPLDAEENEEDEEDDDTVMAEEVDPEEIDEEAEEVSEQEAEDSASESDSDAADGESDEEE